MRKLRINPWYYVPYLLLLVVAGIYLLSNPHGTFLLWVNSHHTPFLDDIFMITNALGEWIFASVVVLALMVFTNYASGIAAIASWCVSGIITQTLKRLIFDDVARPFRFFEGVHDIYFVEGVEMSKYFSFPSGHTTVAFALCSVLALAIKHRPLGLFFFVMAVVAGFSRIYLAQHFLVDTYFGSLIGTTVGILVYNAVQHYLADKPDHLLHRNVLKSVRS